MTKTTIITALLLAALTTEASAWVCGFVGGPHSCMRDGTAYGSSDKVIERSSTDSQGTTTYYDASERVIGRSSKSGDTTTIYDASGRVVGKRQ